MLIILHCKGVERESLSALTECFGVDVTYRVDGPEEMSEIDTDIVDDVVDGQSVLLVVPSHAVGVTYALVEECLKMKAKVFQLKGTQRHTATPGGA
jgi:hypothetical protein